MERIETVETSDIGPFPTMNWGAIVAGFSVALGIAAMLCLGGMALGLGAIHAHEGEGAAKAIGIGASIWMLLTCAGALFVGGMFASWFDGRNDTMVGAMHGLSVWGLTIAVILLVMALGGHHRMHRGPGGEPMHAAMMAESHGMVGADMAILHARLARAVRRDGGQAPATAPPPDERAPMDEASPAPMAGHGWRGRGEGLMPVEMALVHGDNAAARELLAGITGLSDQDADRVLQSVRPQVDKTKEDAKQAAVKAAHDAAAMAAIGFLAVLFSLLTSLLGGWIGANHVHKVYHLRTYRRVDNLP